jgi:membrane associated rhomboid family serine protease
LNLVKRDLGVKGDKDMTYVNWLILLVVSSVVGALTGLLLGGLVGDLVLALIAGILGTISAGIVHNIRIPQLTVIYSAVTVEIPFRVIIYSLFASLIGSAAAVQITSMSGITSSAAIGALAGLIAGILMAILITVYVPHKSKPNQ